MDCETMHTIQKLRAQLQKNWRCPISKRCSIWAMWRAMSRRWRDWRVTRRFLGRWQTSKTRRWRWLIMATKTSRLPFGEWGAGVVPKGCACRPCVSPMAFGSCDRSWRARKPIFASFCAISDSNGPKIRRIITIFIRETAFDTRFYRIFASFDGWSECLSIAAQRRTRCPCSLVVCRILCKCTRNRRQNILCIAQRMECSSHRCTIPSFATHGALHYAASLPIARLDNASVGDDSTKCTNAPAVRMRFDGDLRVVARLLCDCARGTIIDLAGFRRARLQRHAFRRRGVWIARHIPRGSLRRNAQYATLCVVLHCPRCRSKALPGARI